MFWTAVIKIPYNSSAYIEKLLLFPTFFGGSEVQDQGFLVRASSWLSEPPFCLSYERERQRQRKKDGERERKNERERIWTVRTWTLSFYKETSPILAPQPLWHHLNLIKPDYLLKASPPNTMTLRVRASKYAFCGDINIQFKI